MEIRVGGFLLYSLLQYEMANASLLAKLGQKKPTSGIGH